MSNKKMNKKEAIQKILSNVRKDLKWDKFTALNFQESMVYFAAMAEGISQVLTDEDLSTEKQFTLIGNMAIQFGATTIDNMDKGDKA